MGQKNTNSFKLVDILLLIVILCIPVKFIGQEFEWVYSSAGLTNEDNIVPNANVIQVITNSANEIYLSGYYFGKVDFGDGQTGYNFNANINAFSFIAKLNVNKQIIWFKSFKFSTNSINTLVLDENENIVLSGNANPVGGRLYLNPNPSNPIFPLQINATHTNLDSDKIYGYISVFDANGNYLNSKIYESIQISNIVIDQNNDIVAVGHTRIYHDTGFNEYKWGYINKLNGNLNTIWEKTFINQNTNCFSIFHYVTCDSQNNIYFSGSYRKSFVFNDSSFDIDSGSSNFLGKLNANGDENWIIECYDNLVSKLKVDSFDNLYFFNTYSTPFSIQFNNLVVSNPPITGESELVLYKIDPNGNLVLDVPMYGSGKQEINDFTINSTNELILPIESNSNCELNYANQNTVIETYNSNTLLLKTNLNGDLIDYKRIFQNTINNRIFTYTIHTDLDNNIYLGGNFSWLTDFDPNIYNENLVNTYLFLDGYSNSYFYENKCFLLKLRNCDELPLFDVEYNFCSNENSNPKISDIKPSNLNIKWFSSELSQTELSNDHLLISGQTYYYENNVNNCTYLGRFAVQINILPPPLPPTIGSQPCYYQGLKLSDLDIQGQNISFYDQSSGGESVSSDTFIMPNFTYYVTQRDSNCESDRIPVSIYKITLDVDSYTANICDPDKDNFESVNLSNYINEFIGSSTENDFIISYYNSNYNAFNNENPIANYSNFYTSNQTIYIRFYSINNDCFTIAKLNLNLVYPPEIIEIEVNDLNENNSLTILPYSENYLYSLDGINYQNDNNFDNLNSGAYFVYLKSNLANCLSMSDKFYVLSYPKFFTPNGDGNNDNWRIKFSQFEFSINVEIYDRFGKFITFFDKNDIGWDGKMNGKDLPATDYWFKIIRKLDKEIIYHGHFSLIR